MSTIIILLGIVLISFSLFLIIKETKMIGKKNFTAVLKDKEENMSDAQFLIGELRREFAETIIDLQKEIMIVKEQLLMKEEEGKTTVNSVKINDVEKLLKEGNSIEEVSEKLGVGKGEILLIKELYLK